MKPLDDDLSKAIEKMKAREELLQRLPRIDCGVCGAPTCQAFAEDVVLGRAKMGDCIIRQREELCRQLEHSLSYLQGKGAETEAKG